MVTKMAAATGATDWSVAEGGKVSASRIILYLAFGLVALSLLWAGYRVTLGGQPYAEIEGWIVDVIAGAKWFIAPYGAATVRDAIASKNSDS